MSAAKANVRASFADLVVERRAAREQDGSHTGENILRFLPDARRALLNILGSYPSAALDVACMGAMLDMVGLELGEPDYLGSGIRRRIVAVTKPIRKRGGK